MLALLVLLAGCAHEGRADLTTTSVDSGSRQLVFKIAQRQPTRAVVSKLISVMKTRLAATLIKADIFASPHSRLHATIYDGARASYAAKLLSTTGTVVLRIQPRGPEYHPPSGRPFKAAEVTPDLIGGLELLLRASDISSLEAFTRLYVGRYLGIYFDGRLIDTLVLQAPLSDTSEMHGYKLNEAHLRFMAAIIDSGPLPTHVRLLSSSLLTSS